MQEQSIRFNTAQANRQFAQILNKKVEDYFRSRNITKHANGAMYFKTVFMISLYFIPFILILIGITHSVPVMIMLWIAMGFGIGGIGLSIMHDANHGAYSKSPMVNNLLGFLLNVIGGSATNWKIQHNHLHHTYTNIEGHDEDIAPAGILRFSPHAKLRWIHRFQWIYAWFFYGLMTFSWVISKDIVKLVHYRKEGLLEKQGTTFGKELFVIILTKVLYIILMIGLPIYVTNFEWYYILLGFFLMHFVAGLILALIFQPAHVISENKFPLPDEKGNIQNSWLVHQLYTTANFAKENAILSWYVGGLNHQIEHHMYPNICHVHYKKISDLVEETAKEFGYPYISFRTFRGAVVAHARMLYRLGQETN